MNKVSVEIGREEVDLDWASGWSTSKRKKAWG